ncbi:MAG: hypothetical protein HDT35_08485, partial [Clostridiales bacterium]|nr:hypothetical protein [Clostridiales bacterium]
MAETKNLCAQIPTALHAQICEAREQQGLTTAQYITNLLIEYYEMKKNGGNTTMTNSKPEDIVSLILQGVSARYDCCPAPTESETFNRPAGVDFKSFGQAVSHITITDENVITVHF